MVSLTMKPLTSTSNEVYPARPYNMPLDHLLDALPYIVCAIDSNGMFVYANKTAEKILGYTQAELKVKSFFDLLVETDLTRAKNMVEYILAGADVSNYRNQYIKKDGSILPLSWTGKWNENDRLIYFSAYE